MIEDLTQSCPALAGAGKDAARPRRPRCGAALEEEF